MSITRMVGVAAATLALLSAAACSGTGGGGDDGGGPGGYGAPASPDSSPESSAETSADSSAAPTEATAGLATAESEFGTIVVDARGMTIYQFDKDEPGSGTSTCAGECAQKWPAVTGGDAPELDGITGTVDTITGVDGQPQLTLNGWPLYHFAGDTARGDVNGQGVGEVWWVLTPAGEPIRN
ncbi:hypothetical protein [Brevibacterium sp.]|uniref:COG4315 family predicted lipoprotein n=1 Tax=Brevibacterium sp. TaxID=1701 RepID=UPI0028116BD7|nr:hypothetical protein [Brevibacterium sp.]